MGRPSLYLSLSLFFSFSFSVSSPLFSSSSVLGCAAAARARVAAPPRAAQALSLPQRRLPLRPFRRRRRRRRRRWANLPAGRGRYPHLAPDRCAALAADVDVPKHPLALDGRVVLSCRGGRTWPSLWTPGLCDGAMLARIGRGLGARWRGLENVTLIRSLDRKFQWSDSVEGSVEQ